MKVVVAGGTGFIGTPMVKKLAERGDEVVVLTRKARASDRPNVRFSVALDDAAVSREVEGAEAIVGLAGAGVMDERWTEDRIRELRQSRVKSTSALARAAIANKVRVFVSGSAIGIYASRDDDFDFDDQTGKREPPHATGILAKVCEEWEAAADPARAAGVRVAHPRIGIVLGANGGALGSMVPPFKAFVGGPVGSGKQWVSWIHLGDMVDALTFAIDEAKVSGTYNCTAPHPVRMDEFAKELGHALDRPAAIRTPGFAIKLAMGERANVILEGSKVVPSKLQSLSFPFRFPDLRPALEDIFKK